MRTILAVMSPGKDQDRPASRGMWQGKQNNTANTPEQQKESAKQRRTIKQTNESSHAQKEKKKRQHIEGASGATNAAAERGWAAHVHEDETDPGEERAGRYPAPALAYSRASLATAQSGR